MSFSERKLGRLQASIEWSQKRLEFPREKRVTAVEKLSGYHYMEGGAEQAQPVNMIKLATDIYVRNLAARAPRVLVSAAPQEMKPAAASLEVALNMIPGEIKLDRTLKRLVTEALFSFGIAKVGLHATGEAMGHEYGSTFVDVVTLDDYFIDMTAHNIDLIQYEGNDYWPTMSEVKESLGFGSRANGLQADTDSFMGERGERQARGISADGTAEPYEKRIWLRDVWLPAEHIMLTYAVKSKKLLRESEWEGPIRGPYPKLGFSDVPGNLLPLPPVSVWRDLHNLANVLFRKLGNQADGQKSVLGFSGGDDDGVSAFKNAKDGDGIRWTGSEPKRLEAGGVSPNTLAFYLQCKELFSYFAGNLDSLGGLAPMTETVGQDKLLAEAASAQLSHMASATVDFIRELFRDLAFYEWSDPIRRRELKRPIPGMQDMSIVTPWGAEDRQGDFNVFHFDIDVFSMRDDSPSLKLQRLGLIMDRYVFPLLPEIQRQSGSLGVQELLSIVAKLSDFDELNEIITFTTPSSEAAGQQPAPIATPSQQSAGPQSTAPPASADQALLQSVLAEGQTQEGVQ